MRLEEPFFGEIRGFAGDGVDPLIVYTRLFLTVRGASVLNPSDPDRLDRGRFKRIWTAPEYYGGLGNTFQYKGFDLTVFIQFTKQKGRSHLSDYYKPAASLPANMPVEFLNRWRKAGDETAIQKLSSYFSQTPLHCSLRSIF